jgi:hypothetical protein
MSEPQKPQANAFDQMAERAKIPQWILDRELAARISKTIADARNNKEPHV